MKKILLALCVATAVIGCHAATNPAPVLVIPVPSVVLESDNNKLFSVAKGSVLTIQLNQGNNSEFLWAVDADKSVGGLTLKSETEAGGLVRFVVQADSPGVLSINYIDVGGKVLKTFLLKVEVK